MGFLFLPIMSFIIVQSNNEWPIQVKRWILHNLNTHNVMFRKQHIICFPRLAWMLYAIIVRSHKLMTPSCSGSHYTHLEYPQCLNTCTTYFPIFKILPYSSTITHRIIIFVICGIFQSFLRGKTEIAIIPEVLWRRYRI